MVDQTLTYNTENLDYIANAFVKGIDAAKTFFNYDASNLPIKVTVSQKSDAKGPIYFHGDDIIGLPFKFLREYIMGDMTLDSLQQHKIKIGFPIPEKKMVPFSDWLTAGGVEETIHLLQNRCHPDIKESLQVWDGYSGSAKLNQLLASHEVEARFFADKILPTVGIQPMWAELDHYLKETYPDRYDQSTDYSISPADESAEHARGLTVGDGNNEVAITGFPGAVDGFTHKGWARVDFDPTGDRWFRDTSNANATSSGDSTLGNVTNGPHQPYRYYEEANATIDLNRTYFMKRENIYASTSILGMVADAKDPAGAKSGIMVKVAQPSVLLNTGDDTKFILFKPNNIVSEI